MVDVDFVNPNQFLLWSYRHPSLQPPNFYVQDTNFLDENSGGQNRLVAPMSLYWYSFMQQSLFVTCQETLRYETKLFSAPISKAHNSLRGIWWGISTSNMLMLFPDTLQISRSELIALYFPCIASPPFNKIIVNGSFQVSAIFSTSKLILNMVCRYFWDFRLFSSPIIIYTSIL